MEHGLTVDRPSRVGEVSLDVPSGARLELGGCASVKWRLLDGRALGPPAIDIDRAPDRDAARVRPSVRDGGDQLHVADSPTGPGRARRLCQFDLPGLGQPLPVGAAVNASIRRHYRARRGRVGAGTQGDEQRNRGGDGWAGHPSASMQGLLRIRGARRWLRSSLINGAGAKTLRLGSRPPARTITRRSLSGQFSLGTLPLGARYCVGDVGRQGSIVRGPSALPLDISAPGVWSGYRGVVREMILGSGRRASQSQPF